MARLWAGRSVARDFSFLQNMQTDTGGPLSFLFNGHQRFCPRGQSGRSLKPSTRLLVKRLMSEVIRMISGFHYDVNEICAPLGFYVAYSASSLLTFRTAYQSHLQELSSPVLLHCLILEDGISRLSRNVGTVRRKVTQCIYLSGVIPVLFLYTFFACRGTALPYRNGTDRVWQVTRRDHWQACRNMVTRLWLL